MVVSVWWKTRMSWMRSIMFGLFAQFTNIYWPLNNLYYSKTTFFLKGKSPASASIDACSLYLIYWNSFITKNTSWVAPGGYMYQPSKQERQHVVALHQHVIWWSKRQWAKQHLSRPFVTLVLVVVFDHASKYFLYSYVSVMKAPSGINHEREKTPFS